ncbi:MAG: L-lactate permease [Silicimonas sp.]
MAALLAATPLAVIMIGMGVLRRSALVAGGAGLAVAVLLSLTAFRPAQGELASLMRGVTAEAGHATLTILWIILPALAIFELQKQSDAIAHIRNALASLTDDRSMQAILIAWFFGLFMEGAAGFGTPVALAAPLLVGLGYAPVRAVVLALLGHAAGVSFGAVGTPALAQIAITGLTETEIAGRTAALHAVCAPFLLLAMVRLAANGPLSRGDVLWTATAAVCFLLPSLALAALIGPELPTLGGALMGGAAFIVLLRRGRAPVGLNPRQLIADLSPYLLILLLVLLTRLIPPIQRGLSVVNFSWTFDGYSGSFQPFYHPGTMLFLGLALAAIARGQAAMLLTALAAALRRLLPVALALLVMLALSRLMVHAGMIASLAAAAASVGPAWPVLAPFVGVLGTFITGSATASNILFTDLQLSTAQSLALPVPLLVAAQGFGAAIGNIVAPHNIIAGSATVGLVGREGDVLARTVTPCLLYAGLGAVMVFLGINLL